MTAPDPGLDPAQVARFRGDVADTLGAPLATDGVLALAVSGGPDSMAMLALATAAFPGRVCAATVDHGLRPAAADEAAMVARWCVTRGVPHRTLPLRETIGKTAIQATARALRYDVMGQWVIDSGAVALATAHHVEDQAETFLMRAVRGTGPAGLAGVRLRRTHAISGDGGHFTIIRPLLGWRRAALRAVVTNGAIPFVDDPSNDDTHFERVRVRHMLRETPWLDPAGLARTAAHAGSAQRALEAMAAWLWDERLVSDDAVGVKVRLGDLPRDMQRMLARRAIARVREKHRISRPVFESAGDIEPVLESLRAGTPGTKAGVMVSEHCGIWYFRPEPPRRSS
ncbi:tRNA lysidine(34) synthetase TilS [Sphingomonas sp. PAMC 26617]|uniref:tRNA lysidine(34) synthetase TilS n=1 Tax=Sphingomonas sp. PAMC 26617 TaxID=1112216 RepID=UPI00028A2E5E|nr:tRNA lysidine(34) synthetase TilS [Sphingomonas sp. PAMC 26617]